MTDRYEPILPPEALDPEYGVTDEERKPRHTPEERAAAFQALFDRWREEESEDPREAEADWAELKAALDSHRPPGRKLFADHEHRTP